MIPVYSKHTSRLKFALWRITTPAIYKYLPKIISDFKNYTISSLSKTAKNSLCYTFLDIATICFKALRIPSRET